MGTSASLSATEGTSSTATGSMAPATGALIKFTIGVASQTAGNTSAVIDNLRVETTDSNKSAGNALLTGVQSEVNMPIDASKTSFGVRTNTLHNSYGDQGAHGASIVTGNSNANASSNSSLNSNTNVDINSTQFTSVFMQAF
ncbi:hypothetical protein KBY58_11375 [Cyanobium sp. HWJ4-Hawea]|uniref:hypothetical protein n=1 Tax=Cyanobium sp. HWJ4-Hawea TaxID=2823713 RepID=UPI0020CE8497|nr:hypothetical protein [Cyanobium sp. HWJ4-Hawea]MCP9810035.1 hypothetical protein [Cyanobium sp. HWJ4-Hawea]